MNQVSALGRGDRLPRMLGPVPGPRSRHLARALARWEAPGINTVTPAGAACSWQAARGANVLDVDGNRYIDLTAGFGVAAVGHRHPRVVEALRRQSQTLIHGLGDVAAHPLRGKLARRLCRLVPVDDAQIYWAISGADAVEVAIKTALLATGRHALLVFEPSYHGTTLGALAASSRPAFRQPFAAHLHPHLHRLPHGCETRALARALERRDIACAVVEPIVGREGVRVPPAGWLPALAAACRHTGTLLVADEIFTGFGRTGRWFAVDHEGVRPDLLCCGKALAGGLPIGAVAGRRALISAWKGPGEARHTATFVAHPLACASALASLDSLVRQRLCARAARLGARLAERLADWPRRHDPVLAVRGRGLLWGLEMARPEYAKALVRRAASRGLLALAGGPTGTVLQLCPPLVITQRQLDRAISILDAILDAGFDAGFDAELDADPGPDTERGIDTEMGAPP